mgnify:CR=1 FL=1|jgi:aspartate/methionine/tyrosine aminotransferase
MSGFAERVSRLEPTAVNRILAEVQEVRARGAMLVSLMRGEPDLPTPAHITEAAAAALHAGRTTYPDNLGELKLRKAVAAKLARDNGLAYDPATEILATTGATFGIYAALMALVNEGDEVLLPDPLYDAYQSPVRLAGGVPVRLPAAIREGRFELDLSRIPGRPRVLILNTPWNPCGSVLREDELRRIAEVVLDRGMWLISDEIYEAITYGGARHVSPAAAVPELRPRTVLVNSLSKTYAMTGWRVGYTAAPPEVTRAMFLVLQQSSRGPATFVQDAAAVALAGPQDCVAAMRGEYTRRLGLVTGALDGVNGCRVLRPEGGFFAMLDVRGLGVASDELRRRLLHEHHVVVIHGSAYGPSGEGTLRVSFASGGETLREGLERLRKGLSS